MNKLLACLLLLSSIMASSSMVALEATANIQAEKACRFCQKSLTNALKCSACKSVFYCDRQCQSNHWKEHKQRCSSLKQSYEVAQEMRVHNDKLERIKERLNKASLAPTREEILKDSASKIRDFRAFAEKHYGEKVGQELYSTLDALGKDFLKLLVDQSLMLKLSDFVQYVKNHREIRDPWLFYREFMNHCGSVTVYRALYITEDEHELVLRRGLESRSLISAILPNDSLDEMSLPKRISCRMNRCMSDNSLDPVVSISTDSDLARLIGEMFSGVAKKPNGKMYIYEITIPKAAIFNHSENKLWFEPTFRERAEQRYQEKDWFVDPKIEKFVFFKVNPSEIKLIGRYEPRDELENHLAYEKMRQRYPSLFAKYLPVAFIVLYLAGFELEESYAKAKEADQLLFGKDTLTMTAY